MDNNLMASLNSLIETGKPVALAIVTKVHGSTPANVGAMMLVPENGTLMGTVGGGKLESEVIKLAYQCLQAGKSCSLALDLDELPMLCGGGVEVFIKVFAPRTKLLIVGDGHVALEIYKLGLQLGFYPVIFSDRPEYGNRERFPQANEIIVGAIEQILALYPIDRNCYITIATRGHIYDELALKTVVNSEASYIGMIGSRNKSFKVLQGMSQAGIDDEALARVYTPIGLGLGGNSPAEIAVSIMAEILLIKNQGVLAHLRDHPRKS